MSTDDGRTTDGRTTDAHVTTVALLCSSTKQSQVIISKSNKRYYLVGCVRPISNTCILGTRTSDCARRGCTTTLPQIKPPTNNHLSRWLVEFPPPVFPWTISKYHHRLLMQSRSIKGYLRAKEPPALQDGSVGVSTELSFALMPRA